MVLHKLKISWVILFCVVQEGFQLYIDLKIAEVPLNVEYQTRKSMFNHIFKHREESCIYDVYIRAFLTKRLRFKIKIALFPHYNTIKDSLSPPTNSKG